ncbi:serine/threonine-protein kinase Nek2 isoform X1 [Synchiropus splendidus]|uniref:serine/threonine-protein kinase Nek2 isoform X1 n=1 Tax=Synchiropus splendidus TaxID=270530 RepID=UPI00237E445D|nr:serine/threonine-protein kinase Nek2 isoform X1 [Synchiropus splendidus]XP_053736742.1 serine/threonine-protein kinase Nek2 isoform X1 [Synchiropus splendidus]
MPSRVEDYEVLHTIGSGSYGRCQKVRRRSDGKMLVWKELDYGTMGESEKQMLVSEVNLLRELKHPNIVRYYDRIIDRFNTKLYIVMEYCEGGDLSSLIARCIKERRFLEEQFILRVMAQLTLALNECHRRRDGRATVLHRDLKPANIFLDSKQNVKLGDFGLARILNHDTSFAKTFVGTPYYMSPEQINQMSYNEKSDIWSLGCLLYELCALSPPFTAYNQRDLAEKIRVGKFRRIPCRYSEELSTLLSKMLHLKDYMRPSVDSILQSSLLADAVSEEQKKAQTRRQSPESDCPLHKPTASAELRLKEQLLQDRERCLKEREERLEQRERELCARERLATDKLERAENLLKNLNQLQRNLSPYCAKAQDVVGNVSPSKRKVHFAGETKENQQAHTRVLPPEQSIQWRLRAAKMRAQALSNLERECQQKSRQLLGIR